MTSRNFSATPLTVVARIEPPPTFCSQGTRSIWAPEQRTCSQPPGVFGAVHDAHAASYADRVVFLGDGDVVDEMREPTADSVLDHLKFLEG